MPFADDRGVATGDPLGHRVHQWQDAPGGGVFGTSTAVGYVEAAAS